MKKFMLVACMTMLSIAATAQLNYHKGQKPAQHIYRNPQGAHLVNLFPDSVRIEFPELGALVVLESKSREATLAYIQNLPATLTELHQQLQQSVVPDSSGSYRVDVVFQPGGTKAVAIQQMTQPSTRLLIKDEKIIQLLPPGWEVSIQSPKTKAYIYATRLEGLQTLASQNYAGVAAQLNDFKIFAHGRKPVKARFIMRNGLVEYNDLKFEEPLDQISLAASAGVGVLKNTLYPELTATLGFTFADRFNRRNHRFELSYSSQYFAQRNPEGTYDNSVSSFLAISYSKNFEKQNRRPAWVGLGAALLVNETGNYFIGKTAKFFLITDLGTNKLSLMPEFYLTEDFKKFQFGMRLQYRF